MNDPVIRIREEKSDDTSAIRALHRAEFKGNAEADLVDQLRDAGEVVLSLVALAGEKIIGHVLYSHLVIDGKANAVALAPFVVDPAHQKQGIGSRLIEEAHDMLREKDIALVFVLGDPAFYQRLGFSISEAAGFRTPYNGPYLMSLKLVSAAPVSGTVVYPASFAKIV